MGLQVRGQGRHAAAADELAQVEAMSAEIAHDERRAGLRRIGAPSRLLAIALAGP